MKDFFRGMGRSIGIVAGFLPIAVSFGAIALQSGLTTPATLAMSVWIFAGASQFAAVEALNQGLPWLSIVLTVWLINLRHIPMSFAAQKLYRPFGQGRQLILCHGLVDEGFALETSEDPQPFLYYLGLHLTYWAAWITGTWLGCQFGQVIPERWLEFALPALFLYLLVNAVQRRWSRSTALILAIGVALVLGTQRLGSIGILVSMVAIALLSSFVSRTSPSKEQDA